MKEQINSLEKFLLWSSSADRRILSQKECLTERYKYSTIGTTVLLTAVMATFSGGYALFLLLASLPASIIGGSFFGLTIFNFNRFFILISKSKSSQSRPIFYTVTGIRLSIALLLSLMAAKSLQLKLFEGEINREIREENIVGSEKLHLSNLEQRLRLSQQEKQKLYGDWQRAKRNDRKEAEAKRRLVSNEFTNGLEQQFEEADSNILLQQQEIYKLQQAIENTLQSSQTNSDRSEAGWVGLVDRLSVLEKIASRSPTIRNISLLITALLIIMETAPILIKTLSRGAYDALLEQQENHGIYDGYLRDRKAEKLQKALDALDSCLQSAIDFERETGKSKEKYLKLKEKNKEKIRNGDIRNIKENLDKQHDRETLRFFDFCERQMESYIDLISQEIQNHPHVIEKINQEIVNSEVNDRTIKNRIRQYLEDNRYKKK